MRIYLDIDENKIIRDCKFKTFGCGAAVATSSMATELVKGKTIEEALKVTNKAVMEALDGLPPVKVHCSLLAAVSYTHLHRSYLWPDTFWASYGSSQPFVVWLSWGKSDYAFFSRIRVKRNWDGGAVLFSANSFLRTWLAVLFLSGSPDEPEIMGKQKKGSL